MSSSVSDPTRLDWSHFDPRDYLREYYADVGPENTALLRFLAEVYRELPPGGCMLDFGGGPTVYQLISAAARVSEIHFSDYLAQNLEEVRRWLRADPLAFDWSPFIRTALELERGRPCTELEVEARAQEIRARVSRVVVCDASKNPPLDSGGRLYDVVLTNFCAESATSDPLQWQAYMANIASLLRPGGWLVTAALLGATCYSVGPREFPAVSISPEDLLELLDEIGFRRKDIRTLTVPADRPSRDYGGIVLAVGRKHPVSTRSRD